MKQTTITSIAVTLLSGASVWALIIVGIIYINDLNKKQTMDPLTACRSISDHGVACELLQPGSDVQRRCVSLVVCQYILCIVILLSSVIV